MAVFILLCFTGMLRPGEAVCLTRGDVILPSDFMTTRRAVFVTEVLRPYRHSSAALEIAATEFLDEEAAHGPEVWLYPRVTSSVVKTVRTTPELPAAEQVTLQALLHLADGDAASAAESANVDAIAAAVAKALASDESFQ